jgi:hypothetical protein
MSQQMRFSEECLCSREKGHCFQATLVARADTNWSNLFSGRGDRIQKHINRIKPVKTRLGNSTAR